MTARTSASRGHRRRRRPTGAITASTKATFSPDTARRWVRPVPWKSSVSVAGWARSSPITRPVKSDRSTGRSDAAPLDSARRRRLAKAATALAGGPGSMRAARSRAATWRTTSHGAGPTTGASCPVTRMCSPANRGASAATVDPPASSSTWRRPRRTSAREPAGVRVGSDRTVTTAVTGPDRTPCSPSSARWPRPLVSTVTARHSTSGRRSRSVAPRSAPPSHRAVPVGRAARRRRPPRRRRSPSDPTRRVRP